MEPVHMYFIALVLPEKLDRQIRVHKQFFFERYQCRVGLKSPAHLTLVPPFWLAAEMEALLLADTEIISAAISPFIVTTKDFSCFRPRTIFIALEENPQLQQLKQQVDGFFKKQTAYKIKPDERSFHPHITLATRDLHKKAFQEAWPGFEKKEFRESWTAEGLSVLRHNGKIWEVIFTGKFAGKEN